MQQEIELQLANRVIGFFVAKGLLFAPHITADATVKLSVKDVLKVGEELEPRILEVFPAALIHFPATFLDKKLIPGDLQEILKKLKGGAQSGPSFRSIPFSKMRHWALKKLADGRTKPLEEKKIMKSYRLSPKAIEKLRVQSRSKNKSETQIIEELIEAL